jgi:integrase/recombinase XerC
MLGMIAWTIEVESPRADTYRDTRGPGEAAIERMRAVAAARGDHKGLRDVAILRLLHGCALRRGEVASLDLVHYEPEHSRLWVLGKARGGQRQWVTTPPTVKKALEAWIEARGREAGPLFTALDEVHRGHRLTGSGIYWIVKQLGKEAGAVTAKPHGLRHTAITTGLDKTNDVRAVQQFSRHRSVQTLMIYDDARRDMAGKVAALISGDKEGEADETAEANEETSAEESEESDTGPPSALSDLDSTQDERVRASLQRLGMWKGR